MKWSMGIIYIIFAPILGGLIQGIDRKITAKMQGRIGPPILQPFYDVQKLFRKEVVVVNRAEKFFLIFYLIFMIFTGVIFFSGGDILLVTFAFTLTSIFLVIGAYSTNSPYSTIGAERELLQMMSYEPMFLLTSIGFYLAKGTFNVGEIIIGKFPTIVYLPGIFIGFIFILTIKLRKSPFDLSSSHHAHQEIVKGLTTEFAGPTLGLVEIAEWYENVLLYGVVYIFFRYNSTLSIVLALGICLLVYFLEILIDNTFPRVKWKHLLESSWIISGTIGFTNIVILSLL
ncbi:MAG: NADH-quinone oxidoreductase subunit H [Clostridium sp.]|nr:NADH-quinone oxidoreductase subunit H [Clostridium sp.]